MVKKECIRHSGNEVDNVCDKVASGEARQQGTTGC